MKVSSIKAAQLQFIRALSQILMEQLYVTIPINRREQGRSTR